MARHLNSYSWNWFSQSHVGQQQRPHFILLFFRSLAPSGCDGPTDYIYHQDVWGQQGEDHQISGCMRRIQNLSAPDQKAYLFWPPNWGSFSFRLVNTLAPQALSWKRRHSPQDFWNWRVEWIPVKSEKFRTFKYAIIMCMITQVLLRSMIKSLPHQPEGTLGSKDLIRLKMKALGRGKSGWESMLSHINVEEDPIIIIIIIMPFGCANLFVGVWYWPDVWVFSSWWSGAMNGSIGKKNGLTFSSMILAQGWGGGSTSIYKALKVRLEVSTSQISPMQMVPMTFFSQPRKEDLYRVVC